MAKLVVLVLAFVVVYWIFKGYRRKMKGAERRPKGVGGEDMVRCEQCGVHLPRSESLLSDEVFYCSAEHRRAHQRID